MLTQTERYATFTVEQSAVPEPFQLLDSAGNLHADTPPLSDEEALEGLRAMLLGRRFDELCINLQRRGLMVTLAPGIGQEACSVGSALALDSSRDWFVPQYREVAGQFLHGFPLVQGFLWHMGSPRGFYIPEGLCMLPFQAAVAGQISHAVGLGWGLRHQGRSDVVVVHFGDGATSEGDFHEPANLAGVVQAPVIFICQNNYWAISTPREWQTAAQTIAQKAIAYGFPGVLVDGNDLFAVYEVTRQAVERARRGDGPTLIEAVTYRLGIHTTADDASRYEPPEYREQWTDKDPLLRVQRYLERRGKWDADIAAEMEQQVKEELDAAWQEARAYPRPDIEASLEYVFAEMTPRLLKQRQQMEGDASA
jgi:pyruvate dehydrogenase E1 component alpha subunit